MGGSKGDIGKMKPFEIFIDTDADHFMCRWYCKLLFWKKHPQFIHKRVFIDAKELLDKHNL